MSDTIVIDGEVELLNVIDGDPDVFIGGGGSQPTGTKSILLTEAGTKTEDVASYASAEINAVKSATASGAVASFSDGAEDVPMDSCLVNIEPVQSGSGDPSPSNVRPISGWSEVNVYVSPTQSEQDATEYSVSLGQTVYGGTLDVSTGELTVTWGTITLNGSETWGGGGNQGWYTKCLTLAHLLNYSDSIICDRLKTYINNYNNEYVNADSGITAFHDSSGIYPNNNWIYAKGGGATTGEEFQAWLASNPLQVVYLLKTPTTVQLSPTEVKTLLGSNSVWADSGDISVGYKADIFLYADSLETIIDTLTGGA